MPGALTWNTQPRQDRPLRELGLHCPGLTGHRAALPHNLLRCPFSPASFLSSSLPKYHREKGILLPWTPLLHPHSPPSHITLTHPHIHPLAPHRLPTAAPQSSTIHTAWSSSPVQVRVVSMLVLGNGFIPFPELRSIPC